VRVCVHACCDQPSLSPLLHIIIICPIQATLPLPPGAYHHHLSHPGNDICIAEFVSEAVEKVALWRRDLMRDVYGHDRDGQGQAGLRDGQGQAGLCKVLRELYVQVRDASARVRVHKRDGWI